MNARPRSLGVRLALIVAAALLMYFVPALAALGAVVYLVWVTRSAEPGTTDESVPGT